MKSKKIEIDVLKKIKKFIEKQRFQPNILSIALNRSFIGRYFIYRAIAKYASQASGRMLDFGCGAKPYRDLFKIENYVGVDIEVSGHDHQQEEIDVFYDGSRLPFVDASFDFVLSSEVLEHVFNLPEILIEIHRVLVSGGSLLLTVPFAYPEHEVPYDFARYTRFGMKALLERHGFRVEVQEGTTCFASSICQLMILMSEEWIRPGRSKILAAAFVLFWSCPWSLLGYLLNIGYRGQGGYPLNYVFLAIKN
jgi:SAM-dependent methyltransferase